MPVISDERDGPHIGAWLWALRNTVDCSAIRSMFGVNTCSNPKQLTKLRKSSMAMNSTFGFDELTTDGFFSLHNPVSEQGSGQRGFKLHQSFAIIRERINSLDYYPTQCCRQPPGKRADLPLPPKHLNHS
jgi:hypothetical protein